MTILAPAGPARKRRREQEAPTAPDARGRGRSRRSGAGARGARPRRNRGARRRGARPRGTCRGARSARPAGAARRERNGLARRRRRNRGRIPRKPCPRAREAIPRGTFRRQSMASSPRQGTRGRRQEKCNGAQTRVSTCGLTADGFDSPGRRSRVAPSPLAPASWRDHGRATGISRSVNFSPGVLRNSRTRRQAHARQSPSAA